MRINKRLVAAASSVALVGGLALVSASPALGVPLPKVNTVADSVTCNDLIGKIKFSVPLHLGGTTANNITLTLKSLDCIDNDKGVYDEFTNPGGVTLKQVSQKGILTSSNNDCLGLSGLSTSTSGAVIGKWATQPHTPALDKDSGSTATTINVTQTFGGTFNATAGVIPAAWSNVTAYASGQNVARNGDSYTANSANTNKDPLTNHALATDAWTINGPTNDLNSWGSSYGMFRIGTGAGTTAPVVTGAFANGGGANLSFDGTTAESKGTLANECFSANGIKGIQFGIGGFTT